MMLNNEIAMLLKKASEYKQLAATARHWASMPGTDVEECNSEAAAYALMADALEVAVDQLDEANKEALRL